MLVAIMPEQFQTIGTIVAIVLGILLAILGYRRGARDAEEIHAFKWSPYPVSKDCPNCESNEFKQVNASAFIPFKKTRECNKCGTRYSLPTHPWIGRAACIISFVGFATALLILVLRFAGALNFLATGLPIIDRLLFFAVSLGLFLLSAVILNYGLWVIKQQGDSGNQNLEDAPIPPKRWRGRR
jgi:hypothetical protein